MKNYEHLLAERHHLLNLTDKMRIAEIYKDDVWIENPVALKVIGIIENMMNVSSTIQAPCLLVEGEGGTGKTSLIRQLQEHPEWKGSMVHISLAEKPSNLKFKEQIMAVLGLPSSPMSGRSNSNVEPELALVIKLRKIRALCIDELHDSLLVNRLDQRKNLSLLKKLSGHPYNLIIIGFGVAAARHALKSDPQFERRFYQVMLPDWGESTTFRSFLAGIEENLPLKQSSALYSEELMKFILSASSGRMDNVIKLIKSAAAYAITTKLEKITLELLELAADDPWGYELANVR